MLYCREGDGFAVGLVNGYGLVVENRAYLILGWGHILYFSVAAINRKLLNRSPHRERANNISLAYRREAALACVAREEPALSLLKGKLGFITTGKVDKFSASTARSPALVRGSVTRKPLATYTDIQRADSQLVLTCFSCSISCEQEQCVEDIVSNDQGK